MHSPAGLSRMDWALFACSCCILQRFELTLAQCVDIQQTQHVTNNSFISIAVAHSLTVVCNLGVLKHSQCLTPLTTWFQRRHYQPLSHREKHTFSAGFLPCCATLCGVVTATLAVSDARLDSFCNSNYVRSWPASCSLHCSHMPSKLLWCNRMK